jgi:hypothetical protein
MPGLSKPRCGECNLKTALWELSLGSSQAYPDRMCCDDCLPVVMHKLMNINAYSVIVQEAIF